MGTAFRSPAQATKTGGARGSFVRGAATARPGSADGTIKDVGADWREARWEGNRPLEIVCRRVAVAVDKQRVLALGLQCRSNWSTS